MRHSFDCCFSTALAIRSCCCSNACLQPPNVRISKIDPLPDLVRNVLGAADKRPDDTQLYKTLEQLTLGPGEAIHM